MSLDTGTFNLMTPVTVLVKTPFFSSFHRELLTPLGDSLVETGGDIIF